MTYELALSYLASLNESRIRPGLERIQLALSALGKPHLKYPIVLVGGTNGKGSVVTFMGTALTCSGYRTGRFTSPHLNRFEERISIGSEAVGREVLVELVRTVRETGVKMTYFEFATALSLLYFAQRKVDLAILEVGIGGRWDATNVTDPVLSVITSIEFDHQEWLGRNLEEIAAEKSGIMRKNRPVVAGPMEPAPRDVLLRQADMTGARMILFERDFHVFRDTASGRMGYKGKGWAIEDLVPGLKGPFQLDNAACALAALENLALPGLEICREDAVRGIESSRWPGRFQKISSVPGFIVDSAHNRAAMKALVGALGDAGNVVWLFSALSDKDVRGMTSEMISLSNRFVILPLNHPRAMAVRDLADKLPEGAFMEKCENPKQGMETARRLAGQKGCVVVAGSVVLAGEVLQELRSEGYDV